MHRKFPTSCIKILLLAAAFVSANGSIEVEYTGHKLKAYARACVSFDSDYYREGSTCTSETGGCENNMLFVRSNTGEIGFDDTNIKNWTIAPLLTYGAPAATCPQRGMSCSDRL